MIGGSMELDKNDIISLVSDYLIQEDLELYDINIVNFPSISKIEVYVYSTTNLDYKIIQRLNHQIQRLLEEVNLEKGSYELIVSSPGLERLLKTKRHYEMSLDENIKVKLIVPINNEYTFQGTLINIENENIQLLVENQLIKIDINNIKKARLDLIKFKEKIKN
jgi:ribosome maturation factor RimP